MSKRALTAALVALALATMGTPAAGAPAVRLWSTLRPERLGASTTVSIGFRLAAGTTGAEASPLSAFTVRLPAGMGLAASSLGLRTCSVDALLVDGAGACPGESAMGFGSALVQAPFGSQTVLERARISIFMAPSANGNTTMLFYFDGRRPVLAPLVLESQVIPSRNSSLLSTPIEPISTGPGAPDAALVALQVQLGTPNLRYYKHEHHRLIAYRPKGLDVPEACPRSGFVFAASFTFLDGAHAYARTALPCPSPRPAQHERRTRRSR